MDGASNGNSKLKEILSGYIAITLVISWVLGYYYVFEHKTFIFAPLNIQFFPLMMSPGVVAVAFLLLIPGFRLRDAGFRWCGWKDLGLGLGYPCLMVSCVTGLAIALGIATFEPKIPDTGAYLLKNLKIFPLLFIFALPSHLGEELGWRGFILPKSLKFGRLKAAILSSAVWSLFHLMFAFSPPEGGILGIKWLWGASFLVNIFCAGIVFAWLYLRTKNIWSVYVAHVTWNVFNPMILGNVYSKQASPLFKTDLQIVNGEGLLGCLVNMLFAGIVIWYFTKKSQKDANGG